MKKIILILVVLFSVNIAVAAINILDYSPKIMGPGTTQNDMIMALALARAQKEKRNSLAKLDRDTSSLHSNVHLLVARYNSISKNLKHISDMLAIPSHLASVMRKIETSLTVVKSGAKTAQGVPNLRKGAKDLEKSAGSSLAQVKAARIKTEAIAVKLAPAQKVAAKGSKGFKLAANALNGFDSAVLVKEPKATTLAQYSIYYLPKKQSACIAKKVDVLANDLDKLVIELNRVAGVLLYTPDVPAIKAFENLSAKMDAFVKLRDAAEKLEDRLEVLEGPLKSVENFLGKSFGVNLPYPDPTCFCIRHYKIKVSAKIILQGSAAIEDAIEAALSKTLWKVAKTFGVNKLVNSLVSSVKKELNKIEAKLNLKIDVNIAGLDKLKQAEADLNKLLAKFPKSIPTPKINLKSPNFGLPKVKSGFNFMNINKFMLNMTSPYNLDWRKKYNLDWRQKWAMVGRHPPTYGCK